ncbi:zinc finger CCCH domain-containing protein 62 [Carica papaya]|uniref:zinc finger CCCH domain-containing protein 62 n=1 Tax=Carica papaya TaxID=3649 RepID=UPI000B8CD119|nr:zinc finger CCCH domain-containing protein 62 [Carica papaya]
MMMREETDNDEEWTDSSFSGDWSDLSGDDGRETDEENEGDDDDDDDDDDEDYDEDDEDEDDEESLFNRVIFLLKEGGDLKALNVRKCKAYLRKHGLRIAGTKAICMQRILEHWRIKDGNGEKLYPRSSFIINCTGDVCRGDVVLFTQRVFEKFDKVRRHGRLLGKRTVAGRVIKESYGAAKQQHTFTVEVLWSKGIKKLHPLFPLLVKGRNLYKLKTFRQRWNNEGERHKILAEKHSRGTAARLVRAMKKRRKARSGSENGDE